jgi:hypothetical protein
MHPNNFLETASRSDTQEFSKTFYYQRVHYHIRKCCIYQNSIFISFHLRPGRTSGCFSFRSCSKILDYFFLLYGLHVMNNSSSFDFIDLIIIGEVSKLWNSSLYSFFLPLITWQLFGPNIVHNTLCSNRKYLFLSIWQHISHPCQGISVINAIIQLNSLLFMCRVNSYKVNYRHSTVQIYIST